MSSLITDNTSLAKNTFWAMSIVQKVKFLHHSHFKRATTQSGFTKNYQHYIYVTVDYNKLQFVLEVHCLDSTM